MTAIAVHSVGRPTKSFDAVRLLQIELWLLVLIPARLIFKPLGAIGTPAAVFGVFLFGVWAVDTLATSIRTGPACVPVRAVVAAFAAAVLGSYLLMNMHSVPLDEGNSADRYLITLAAYAGVAFMAAEGLRTRDDLMRMVRSVVDATAVFAAIGIVQFRTGFDVTIYIAKIPGLTANGNLASILARSSFRRPAGTASHPIEFGVVVGSVLALGLHLALFDRVRAAWKRYFSLGLIAVAVPFSISRSSLLCAVIVLLYFWFGANRHYRAQIAGAVAGFTVLMFVAVPGLLGTLKGFVVAGQSDSSISTRTSDYAAVARYLRRSPLIGRGPGTFLPRFRILDNQYLMSSIEIGLLGVAALLALFAVPMFLGRGARHRSRDMADRNLGQMFAAIGAATVAASFTFDSLSFPLFTTYNAFLTGLAGAFWLIMRDESKQRIAVDPSARSHVRSSSAPQSPD